MNDTPPSPANGQYTDNGRPTHVTSLTPHLVVADAAAAIALYRDAFGARVGAITRTPDGAISHAQLFFGAGGCTLSDPLPEYGLVAPSGADEVSASFSLYLPDVDAACAAALAAGATLREGPPATFVSGDRFASLLDPFGVRWAIMTRVEDLSPEESDRRVAEWAASLGGSA